MAFAGRKRVHFEQVDCQKLTWEACVQNGPSRGILPRQFLDHIQKVHNAGFENYLELSKSLLQRRAPVYFPLRILETLGTVFLLKLWIHENYMHGVVMHFGTLSDYTGLVANISFGHPTHLAKRVMIKASVTHYTKVQENKDGNLRNYRYETETAASFLALGEQSPKSYAFYVKLDVKTVNPLAKKMKNEREE